MGKLILITGGARSGKSTYAENLAKELGKVTYIATAVPFDGEMRDRIQKHRERRPAQWRTVEQYRDLGETLENIEGTALLDCVTVMITNLMMDMDVDWEAPSLRDGEIAEQRINGQIDAILSAARKREGTLIAVTNELGMGLVPVSAFSRLFRDVAGRVNQRLAAGADEVYFLVSGIPMRLK